MVRFQPPSAAPSREYDEDDVEERSAMSSEAEERADEYEDGRGSGRRGGGGAAFRPSRAAKDAPNSAGRHRFAAPQLDDDDDDETDEEQQLNDTRRQEEDAEADEAYERKYDGRSAGKHGSVYPLISARSERQMSERKPTARRIPLDDAEALDDDGMYGQPDRYGDSRERSSSAARNSRTVVSRKRFVAQQDEEDEQLIDQSQPISAPFAFPTDSSPPAYLVTPSVLFTPGSHTASSADPALLLSQLLAAQPTPPASTTSSTTSLPGVTDEHNPRPRRAFGAGWGVDGKVALIRGSSVTVTRVKGDEQNSDRAADEVERERQGRVAMMTALLQVHHQFAEAQKLPQPKAPASFSAAVVSSSPIALLCDHYIAALTALSTSHPSTNVAASSTSIVPARPFSVASQLRHAISVFQLVKVLYAPEYGSASLNTFLATPAPSTPLPSLPSDFPLQSLSPAADPFGEVYARLHQLKEYLKQQLAPLTPAPSSSSFAVTASPPLFSLLSSYRVTEATELALSSRRLRLATLLPSLSSVTAELTAMCAAQVAEWQNSGVWDVLAEEERQCFLLLAGHKQADDMHWLRGLAMHVCYQTEGDGSVSRGLTDYVRAVEDGKAQPALPPYKYEPPPQRKERRRIRDDDEEDGASDMIDRRRQPRQVHYDTRFELLSVYSGADDLRGLFSPSSSTPSLLDYSLSFHLHHALSLSTVQPYADYHALLSSYLAQLEQSGQWHWAVYVLMSVPHMQRRHRVSVDVERLARGIIGRHIEQSRDVRRLASDEAGRVRVHVGARRTDAVDEREQWLINHIQVPRPWFTSAHAAAAAYYGDYEVACRLYLQAAVDALTGAQAKMGDDREQQTPDEFQAAHRLLVQHVAPAYVVAGALETLVTLPSALSEPANVIAGWKEGGGVYLEYHRVKNILSSGSQADRVSEQQALTDITRRIERLRQSQMARETFGEETALLVERAALRIMLDDCQLLKTQVGSSRSEHAGREQEMIDRHEAALG